MADKQEHHQKNSSPHGHGHHFHVNPGRALSHRLARLSPVDGRSILATLSLPVAAQRRLFPSPPADSSIHGDEADATCIHDGVISYVPHSDGFDDDGAAPKTAEDWTRRRRATAESLSGIVYRFAADGKPVTCIVSTIVEQAMVDVARKHGIPFAVYWIQPATVLAVEYHYFHGAYDHDRELAIAGDDEVSVSVPGLRRRLRVRDFPSFLLDTAGSVIANALMEMFRGLFESMDQWRPTVLVNTVEELEADVLADMKRHLDVVTVGPMLGGSPSSTEKRIHLFEHDDKKRYMEWLQAQPDRSVVYVSFGSVTKVSRRQMDEVNAGLRHCGRPYLLVVRCDGVDDGGGGGDDDDESISQCHGSPPVGSEDTHTQQKQQGMVVGWRRTGRWGASCHTAGGIRRWRPWRPACPSSACPTRSTSRPTRAWSRKSGRLGLEQRRIVVIV